VEPSFGTAAFWFPNAITTETSSWRRWRLRNNRRLHVAVGRPRPNRGLGLIAPQFFSRSQAPPGNALPARLCLALSPQVFLSPLSYSW